MMSRIWFTTSQWEDINQRDFNFDSFLGTFTFSHHHGEISVIKNFIKTLRLSEYSEDISLAKLAWIGFNCSASSSNFKRMKDWLYNMSFELIMGHSISMAMSDVKK